MSPRVTVLMTVYNGIAFLREAVESVLAQTFEDFEFLIVDDASDVVVGAHMVGEEAGELIQGIAIAVRAGLTKEDFDRTVGIHPTGAEEFVTMRTPSRY